MMPTFLGIPFYPNGFPLKQDNIQVDGISLRDIFLRRCRKEDINPSDEEILKEYIVYHINAPIFDNDFTQELRSKDITKMTLDEAIYECMQYGLDPF